MGLKRRTHKFKSQRRESGDCKPRSIDMANPSKKAEYIKVPETPGFPQTEPVEPEQRIAESEISVKRCDVSDAEKIVSLQVRRHFQPTSDDIRQKVSMLAFQRGGGPHASPQHSARQSRARASSD